ncbi:MAG: smalltalk protein [Phocaeicola sp.]|nr:smalltalk protein [Phocaeicola sp.]MBR1596839.1 smalltalk protein [Phocaeicola sp.]
MEKSKTKETIGFILKLVIALATALAGALGISAAIS